LTEAEKVAFVAKIQWDQKIMEKESEKKMAEIEGRKPPLVLESFCKTFQFFRIWQVFGNTEYGLGSVGI